MAKQIKALVKPSVLKWARESLNLPLADAARKIGVKESKLSEWESESGISSPTIGQLRKAANVYKRPLAVFFLSEAPRDFDALKDFRRLPDLTQAPASPKLSLEIRRAQMRREMALELAASIGVDPPRTHIVRSNLRDADHVAAEARQLLGVTLEEQYDWRGRYEALHGWISALERVGVLVFQTGAVTLDEVRGFSISAAMYPVIVVNAKDSPRGRVFTLIHEFAHVLLNRGGLCDLHTTTRGGSQEEMTEIFCNQVAGVFLLPSREFLSEPIVTGKASRATWAEAEIRQLAEKYSVSQEVVLRRLLTLGRISQSFYQQRRQEIVDAYRRDAERTQGGFVPHHVLKTRDLGRAFIRLVLEAYHTEAINSSDVAEMLGVKLKHLSTIEQDVADRAA
jgi:Zn-dependent peptidase ImmA (M78 family)/transcriptional regulator with XRE-family HTH domain